MQGLLCESLFNLLSKQPNKNIGKVTTINLDSEDKERTGVPNRTETRHLGGEAGG